MFPCVCTPVYSWPVQVTYRRQSGVFLYCSLPCVLRLSLSLNLKLICSASVARELWRPSRLCHLRVGIAGASVQTVFYVGSEDPNSGPCVAGFLIQESEPQRFFYQEAVDHAGRLLRDSYPKAGARKLQVGVLFFVCFVYF